MAKTLTILMPSVLYWVVSDLGRRPVCNGTYLTFLWTPILPTLPVSIFEHKTVMDNSATPLACHHSYSLPSILRQTLHHPVKFQTLFFGFPLRVMTSPSQFHHTWRNINQYRKATSLSYLRKPSHPALWLARDPGRKSGAYLLTTLFSMGLQSKIWARRAWSNWCQAKKALKKVRHSSAKPYSSC